MSTGEAACDGCESCHPLSDGFDEQDDDTETEATS
jgi:hypothetical protein